MADTNNKTIPVMGYLANNWSGVNDLTPAVILNPAARPLDLLGWVWGEVQSLHINALALSEGDSSVTTGELHTIYLHRLAPLAVVMEAAIGALMAQQRLVASGGAA